AALAPGARRRWQANCQGTPDSGGEHETQGCPVATVDQARRPRTRRPAYRPDRVRGVLQGGARRTNRSLAACGSDAPDLHAFRSRVSRVASSAPERRRGTCRRDAERRAGERVATFADGEKDRKIKGEGRMAPKCAHRLSHARPCAVANAISHL